MYLDTFAGVVRDIDHRKMGNYYGGCFLYTSRGETFVTGPPNQIDGSGGDITVLPRNWIFQKWKLS